MGLREEILGAPDLPAEEVPVPEWPCQKLLVRGLNGTDRDAWEASLWRDGSDGTRELVTANMRARLVMRCVVDAEGKRLFRDDDADLLGEKSGQVLDRLYDVARRLSGMADGAEAKAAKN